MIDSQNNKITKKPGSTQEMIQVTSTSNKSQKRRCHFDKFPLESYQFNRTTFNQNVRSKYTLAAPIIQIETRKHRAEQRIISRWKHGSVFMDPI